MALLAGSAAWAQTPLDQLRTLEAEARNGNPAFGGFSAQRGASFFRTQQGGDWSCATCHTDDPRRGGKHAVTGKAIEPLAPAANPARFTDAAKTDKWFRRNCRDVLKRECSPQEKGDVVAYLMSLKP
jgi:hypothetical protein